MAILLKVKWIDKSDLPQPHQQIQHIGGDSKEFQWQHSYAQVIEAIERDQFTYYVEKDGRALTLDIGLTSDGHKFLKTRGDGHLHLLNLPASPQMQPSSVPTKRSAF